MLPANCWRIIDHAGACAPDHALLPEASPVRMPSSSYSLNFPAHTSNASRRRICRAWGHRVDLSLGLRHVKHEGGVTREWIESGQWEVELAWERYAAKVQLQSFYDPKGERTKE